ncbi:hypothetical protein [Kineococcus aurantiacus]|uniref:Uncharacterized protein n=1 Tax=Kineococcus aurantiacus TaxID=37633 RepID=A0A7Y9DQB6_9ACTN|nr:hypothetical protein [Kineococcus aurantiacus]NYD24767.1 hypothetical protein [Kineococcus aurantiacus]
MPEASGRSAADLIADLRAYGLSTTEIARELGRSPRMIRKVVRGESSGQLYVAALEELERTGRSRTPPPRRRGRDGELVRVRAPRAAGQPTRRPSEPTGAPEVPAPPAGPSARRRPAGPGAYRSETTYLPGGARQHLVTAPRSDGPGRERARQRLLEILRSAARSQRGGRRNVRFRLTLVDGTTVEVGAKGGYAVSKALSRSRGEGDDPLGWLAGEVADRAYLSRISADGGLDVVGVEATVY